MSAISTVYVLEAKNWMAAFSPEGKIICHGNPEAWGYGLIGHWGMLDVEILRKWAPDQVKNVAELKNVQESPTSAKLLRLWNRKTVV